MAPPHSAFPQLGAGTGAIRAQKINFNKGKFSISGHGDSICGCRSVLSLVKEAQPLVSNTLNLLLFHSFGSLCLGLAGHPLDGISGAARGRWGEAESAVTSRCNQAKAAGGSALPCKTRGLCSNTQKSSAAVTQTAVAESLQPGEGREERRSHLQSREWEAC